MAQKWKKASLEWARSIQVGYLTNPTAKRDFLVQFRGKGSRVTLALIVAIFGAVSLILYYQTVTNGLSPDDIQSALSVFGTLIISILGVAITLISPASAAASILVEKQRRSLDLVFSSPVKPVHYLFGKLMASYRYIWVLMALSLPFTAMSVLMGGASWWNILEAYSLLSLQGLLFTSVGIFFSSLVEKTLSALLYTYAVTIGFCWAMTALAVLSAPSSWNGIFQGGQGPFCASFVPVLVQFAAGSYTSLFGIPVPNTLIALGVTAGAVNLILRSAGGLLSPLKNRERAGLRLQWGGLLAAVSGYLGYVSINVDPEHQNIPIHPDPKFFLYSTLPLLIFIPFLSCYSPDAERRLGHNKLFRFKDTLGKSVAGALPYLYSVIGACGLSFLIGSVASHKEMSLEVLPFLLYAFAFWTLVWSTARFASSFLMGIKTSRNLQILTLAGLVGTPLPLFLAFSTNVQLEDLNKLWSFNPIGLFIYPTSPLIVLIHSFLLFALGGGIALWSEKNYERRLQKRRVERTTADSMNLSNLGNLNSLIKEESLPQHLGQSS